MRPFKVQFLSPKNNRKGWQVEGLKKRNQESASDTHLRSGEQVIMLHVVRHMDRARFTEHYKKL